VKAHSPRASRASIGGELGLGIFVQIRHPGTGNIWRVEGFTFCRSFPALRVLFLLIGPLLKAGIGPAFFDLIYNQRHTEYCQSHVLRNLPFRYLVGTDLTPRECYESRLQDGHEDIAHGEIYGSFQSSLLDITPPPCRSQT
jgi:hypothetical protein